MNNSLQNLYNACQMAKYAADLSIPVEQKPAPEAGGQPVAGMTNNATVNPMSVGSPVYAGPVDAKALAEAKEEAACILAKQASIIRQTYGIR